MQVTLDLPENLAVLLGSSDLSRTALEAMVLEGVRSRRLSVAQARQLLGISSRYEMDGFLKSHGILLTLTAEDVANDANEAAAFRKR